MKEVERCYIPEGYVVLADNRKMITRNLEEARELLYRAMSYKSCEDSCRSFSMGGGALASVLLILGRGGYIDRREFRDLIEKATPDQLVKALNYARPYIEYMEAHPMVVEEEVAEEDDFVAVTN